MKQEIADIVQDFVLNTDRHVFLTGKAGTGKTTLLKKILSQSIKNTVVIAPTGVAAINAGGSTFHSMFHLPITSFIPNNDIVDFNIALNRMELGKHCRFNKEHRKVLEEMQLLIIDEVSMVRSDLLDAVDFVLQYVRRKRQPFGGVQLMMIGDLYQLAPIMRDESWITLSKYYKSPFFFDALALQKMDTKHFELTHIYRQSDYSFIGLLNNIRNGVLEESDYYALESRYFPNYEAREKGYITLTTHNKNAEAINELELDKIEERIEFFDAKIEGDFPPSMFPTLMNLKLKVGAQVMFIRNDVSEDKNFYNGKIGIYEGVNDEGDLLVNLIDDKKTIAVERAEWENNRYEVNEDNNLIEQKVVGTFQQYPLKLAWAITIHKSQGLTFERAIIDVGSAFAPGQVYVALSRCTSLEGIVLKSKITQNSLLLDNRVLGFFENTTLNEYDNDELAEAKKSYIFRQIVAAFDLHKTTYIINELIEQTRVSSIPMKEEAVTTIQAWQLTFNNLEQIAQKFNRVMEGFIVQNDTEKILAKAEGAIGYFTDQLYAVITAIYAHKNEWSVKQKTTKYTRELDSLAMAIWKLMANMYQLSYEGEKLYKEDKAHDITSLQPTPTPKKKEKGASQLTTLEMFLEGKSCQQIADERSLSVGTVYAHFEKLMKEDKLKKEDISDPKLLAELEIAMANFYSNRSMTN